MSMPIWKKTIFINAIKTRIVQENRSSGDILKEYIKLTEDEKTEILNELDK